jgi:hypothetical protein
MKTKTNSSRCRLQLKILAYDHSYYIERIARLEVILARKPRLLEIELIGAGEIPADSALLIRSVLIGRSPGTRVITRARSSLQGGSVLVWLLGDDRIIRDDARVYFRRAELPGEDELGQSKVWKERELRYAYACSEMDPEEGDYARVLELINEYLPVKELAGHLIELPVLRQFGLVENEKLDQFLASVFAKSEAPPESPAKNVKEKRRRRKVKEVPQSQAKK